MKAKPRPPRISRPADIRDISPRKKTKPRPPKNGEFTGTLPNFRGTR